MNVEYLEDGDLAVYDGVKFRRDKKTGYYLSRVINNGKRCRLHVYVWESYHGKVPKGYDVHHIDHDKTNNDIENLIMLSKAEHQHLHALEQTEEQKQKARDNLTKNARPAACEWHKSEVGREWHKQHYEQMKQYLHQKEIYTCKNCGAEFLGTKTGNTAFCSNNCKSEHRRKSGVDNETRICQCCGKEFQVNKYAKTKCCSRKCSNTLRYGIKRCA